MKKDNIAYTLEEWYFDKTTSVEDLSDGQFYELLDCLDFELQFEELENGIKIYYLHDLQDANLGNIEQDIFYSKYEQMYGLNDLRKKEEENWLYIKDSIIDRLEIYLYDYFERDR